MTRAEKLRASVKINPGEWALVKNCECKGPSNSGFLLPVCSVCGASWLIVGVIGSPSKRIHIDPEEESAP